MTGQAGTTIATVDADFTQWRQGREWAAVWAFDLDLPEVGALVADARTELTDLLHPRYRRQPHVSLGFVGLMACGDLPGYDERDLAHDLAQLRELAEGTVQLRVRGWGSFEMVPCLKLADDPWCLRVHEQLTRDPGPQRFEAHVTVGHYAVSVPLAHVWPRLRRLPACDRIGPWTLTRLHLMRYRAADIAGPLQSVGEVDLLTGEWHQHVADPFAPPGG